MKTIPLTQGYVALVDDDDYDKVNQFKWRATVNRRRDGSVLAVYAIRSLPRDGGKRKFMRMHRFLLETDLEVDHRDNDGLNNQKRNLRKATSTQQKQNSRKKKTIKTTSKYKGVIFDKKAGRYSASIRHNGRRHFLGYFDCEKCAAEAYDAEARAHHKEFARLNFPEG